MRDLSKNIFRNFSMAEVEKSDGSILRGRGVVTRMSEEKGDVSGTLPHELGSLDTPLYAFLGSVVGAEAGDSLRFDGKNYLILKAEETVIGKYRLGMHAVLEALHESEAEEIPEESGGESTEEDTEETA